MQFKKILLSTLMASLSFSVTSSALSCSRVLHIDPQQGVFVGRNMDWYEHMGANLIVYPRGIQRQGQVDVNPLTWTSQYGSIITTSYSDDITADGMNEKGFAIHGLWLDETSFSKRDESIPGLSILASIQFYLDNFKTVDEAIRYTTSSHFQMQPYFLKQTGRWVKLHLAIEDASGDSAIIEYINGKPMIYHDKNNTVMTNSPVYSAQLDNLKQYDGFGGDKPLPGTDEPTDRFVRAAYYNMKIPAAKSTQDIVAEVFSILQNVATPFQPIPKWPALVDRTLWESVEDLTHRVYYLHSNGNMTTVYANLDQFNLQAGAPVMKLDLVKSPGLSGDVTNQFQAVS